MGYIHLQCIVRRLNISRLCRHGITNSHFSCRTCTFNKYISTYSTLVSRGFGTENKKSDEVSVLADIDKFTIYEVEGIKNLQHVTSSCLRNLRFSKPQIFALNVDKSKEQKMMDVLLASGITCFNLGSVDVLLNRLSASKRSNGFVGLYVHLDDYYDKCSLFKEDIFNHIRTVCNSIFFLDITVSYQSSFDINKLSKIIDLVCPTVIRFNNGFLRSWNNSRFEFISSKEASDKTTFLVEASLSLSKVYGCTVICSSGQIAIGNHGIMEVAFFPKSPDILSKIYGYDVCSGAILAAFVALHGGNSICPAVVGSHGLEYIHSKSAEQSSGPGTMFYNIIDQIYNLTMAPDSILVHDSNVKFWRCEYIEQYAET